MGSDPQIEPTTEELVTKALAAGVIDQDFADDLRDSEDLNEALGMFYTHITSEGGQPDDLLVEWGIIEPTTEAHVQEAGNRLLSVGTKISYAELTAKLREGEILVATWLRDPANFPHARPVIDEHDHDSVVGKTIHGYYVRLRWFASTTGSVNPIDYGMFD